MSEGTPEILILAGTSRKGKNRVREHGARWTVKRREEAVLCLDGAPGILVTTPDGDWRWIRETDDPDFEIVGRE